MIWAFQILLCLWFGYSLVTLLVQNMMNPIHRFFAGVPLGLFTFAWLVYIVSWKVKLDISAAFPAEITMAIASLLMSIANHRANLVMQVKMPQIQAHAYLGYGFFLSFIMYCAMLRENTYVKGAAYGDLPFHLNIISSFAWGVNNERTSFYGVKSVFYKGVKMAYPFMTNFLSAALISTGNASLRASLLFPSVLISLSLVIGIYLVTFTFTKNHLSAVLSLLIFFNLGGLGWLVIFDGDRSYVDYVHDWGKEQNEYWFHPIFHVLVPQRASLFSMPCCYWTIIALITGVQKCQWKFFLLAAIYVGFMPLIQIHSYVALAQWSMVYAAITFPWKDKSKWLSYIICWAIFGIVANVMAIPQIPVYLKRVESNRKEFVSLNPIWMNKVEQFNIFAPIVCWWRGLGVFAAISLVFGWVTLTREQIILYTPSMVVFVITNLIRYQPWELDNTKLFYAAWIPMALGVVSQFYSHLLRYRKMVYVVAVLLFTGALASGIHTLSCMFSESTLYAEEDFEFGEWLAENLPVNNMTVSSDAHNHMVSTIAGRNMFEGYGGWVASHGLEWYKNERMRDLMCHYPNATELFVKHNISYVLALNNEFPEFNNVSWSDTWKKVYEDETHEVWRFFKPENFTVNETEWNLTWGQD